jgi:glutamate dehydrogenase
VSHSKTTTLVKCMDEESNRLRDTMHERVVADVFIPAGGRPFTVNDSNYAQVGKSTKLVVEGANLFFTASARDKLSAEFKVPIIKDSSANKGGVCCSSMEVLASMLLTEEEIINNKADLNDSILEYIRHLARIEADSLMAKYPGRRDLHRISEEMSREIISRKDELYASYCKLSPDYVFDDLDRFMRPLLPKTLVQIGWHRARTNIPIDYARMMICAFRSSREIYNLT